MTWPGRSRARSRPTAVPASAGSLYQASGHALSGCSPRAATPYARPPSDCAATRTASPSPHRHRSSLVCARTSRPRSASRSARAWRRSSSTGASPPARSPTSSRPRGSLARWSAAGAWARRCARHAAAVRGSPHSQWLLDQEVEGPIGHAHATVSAVLADTASGSKASPARCSPPRRLTAAAPTTPLRAAAGRRARAGPFKLTAYETNCWPPSMS
jgi:hypothetical protein